jgi:hypothetical protein
LVLVVGERRFTTLDDLRRTSAVLKRLGAPVVGMALTNPSVRDDDEDEDEEEDEDEGRHKPRRRSARKRRSKVEAEDEGGDDGGRVSPADTTTVTDVTSFDVTTLVDQASLRLRTEPKDPAVWDVPARPEA